MSAPFASRSRVDGSRSPSKETHLQDLSLITLNDAYRAMAMDQEREDEALAWIEDMMAESDQSRLLPSRRRGLLGKGSVVKG